MLVASNPFKSGVLGRMGIHLEDTTSHQDHGHAWLVCLASFIGYFLVTMGLCTSGILFQEYMKTFDSSHTQAAFIPSIQCSVGALLGVFIAPQVKRFGCRRTTAFGTLLGSSGYILCSFSNKIIHLYFSLGILVGIGNGFLFFSAAVAVQFHFNKRRALASALSTCGVSLAPFVFAPSIQWLISRYTWQGATLQMGAFYLNGFVAAGLMSPATTEKTVETEKESNLDAIDKKMKQSDEHFEFQCNMGTSSDIRYIPVKRSNSDENISEQTTCCNCKVDLHIRRMTVQLVQYMGETFDISLLANTRFIVFTLASSLNLFGHLATYLYLPVKVVHELYYQPSVAAWFISIIGISTTVGRVVSGVMGDNEMISAYRSVHFGLPMFFTGLCTVSAAFMTSLWQLYVYSVAFGCFTGIYFVAQQPLLVKILGVENFPKSFGIMLIFTGGASIMAQPFAGWLVDSTKLIMTPLIVCGSMQSLGGVLAMATWRKEQTETSDA